MLFDLIWNIVGPLLAQRYERVRQVLGIVLLLYLGWFIFRIW